LRFFPSGKFNVRVGKQPQKSNETLMKEEKKQKRVEDDG
jgi:hypothetical protein